MSVMLDEEGSVVEDPIIEVRNLEVSFGMERGTSKVVDDIDLSVQRGEVLGVVGESGSGKSMLASAMLDAVVDPGRTSGEVTYHPSPDEEVDVLGFDKKELKQFRWEEISMVFQGAMSSFNPVMNVREHFKETLRAHDSDVEEGMERAKQLLEDLYLQPDRVLDSYPHELSGGMQQRALIALSLVLEPNVLVMDEPTAALDLLMQRSILDLLKKLKESYDLTLVFITHDLPLVTELADRIAVMYAFQLAEVSPTEKILSDPRHPYTRALLKATPNISVPIDHMQPIEGASPDPVNAPDGCSYHPRCPLADEQCRTEDPELLTVDDERSAACFYWEDVPEKIPLSTKPDTITSPETTTGRTVDTTRNEGEAVMGLNDLELHFEKSDGGIIDSFFGEPDIVRAVDGVNLDIHEKDVVALVGESGCGKTSLGKAAIGIHRPTGGNVEYRGQNIWDARDGVGDEEIPYNEIRRSLQIIHQDPGSSLNPYHRVLRTLSLPLKKWNPDMSHQDREDYVYTMLERVGITPPEDYAQRYPHQLSGGEKQRVALIRALLMNPDLILADEPISALDVSLRVEMMDLMLELQEEFGTSYLFISHDLSNARYITEKTDGRIGVMYLGELVEIGPVNEILENPQHPYTKALKWATPELEGERDEERPIRTIDIPDPIDPPSGCRFHTRCPEAREICRERAPDGYQGESDRHTATCFRAVEDHEYWDSEPLGDGK